MACACSTLVPVRATSRLPPHVSSQSTGSVVGVEVNPALVDLARQRARDAGLNNVSFVAGDLHGNLVLDGQFDALVARYIARTGPPTSSSRTVDSQPEDHGTSWGDRRAAARRPRRSSRWEQTRHTATMTIRP